MSDLKHQRKGGERLFGRLTQYPYHLANALLGASAWPYIWYRTRYFLANNALKIVLHIIEFYFIYLFFSPAIFNSLLILRCTIFLLYGGWWGILELLRDYGRIAKENHSVDGLRNEIICWLIFCVALLFLIDMGFFFWLHDLLILNVDYSEHLLGWYFSFVVIQLNVTFILKVFHSGMYGINRIYRSFYSLVLPSLISVGVIFFAWYFIGFYALPISYVIGSLLTLAFSIYYIKNMYDVVGLKSVVRLDKKIILDFFVRTINLTALLAFLSGALITASGPILVLLGLLFGFREWDYITFLYLYMIIPVFELNVEWAFLFYFDLKKLLPRYFLLLIRRLHYYGYATAVVFGVFSWFFAGAVNLFYIGRFLDGFWFLLPFFLLRSLLAYLQINAFIRRRYWDVITSSLILTLTLIPLQRVEINMVDSVVIILGATLLSVFILRKKRFRSESSYVFFAAIKPYFYWLSQIKAQKRKIFFYLIRLDKNSKPNQVSYLARRLNQKIKNPILWTRLSQHELVGYAPFKRYHHLGELEIFSDCAGLVRHVEIKKINPSQFAQELPFLVYPNPVKIDVVIAEFQKRFLEGGIYTLLEGGFFKEIFSSGTKPDLPDELCQSVFYQLKSYLSHPHITRSHSGYFVSALIFKGVIRTIFLIPEGAASREKVSQWFDYLQPINHKEVLRVTE